MRPVPRLTRTLALLALPVLGAAPFLSTHAAPRPARPHATVHVVLRNFAFSPQTITIAPGTTVVWAQQDQDPHTVTSDTQAWPDSGNLTAGHTFAHTFTTAGTYTYHCAVHPTMTAKVVVASPSPRGVGSGARPGAGHTTLVAARAAQMLVTGAGMTLYLYSPDKRNTSVCVGGCAATWPPVLVPTGVSPPTTLPGISGTFGAAPRADGTRQLTYEGAPLYTFSKDKAPGDMSSQGLGGLWWAVVVRPASAGDDHGHGHDRTHDRTASTPSGAATPTPAGYYGGQSSDDHHGGSGQDRRGTPTPPASDSHGQGRDDG